MPARISRFPAWFIAFACGALLLAACQNQGGTSGSPGASASAGATESAAANEPNELTVLEWSGYEAPDFWTDFKTASPDTAVDFEFGISDADILSLMEGGLLRRKRRGPALSGRLRRLERELHDVARQLDA